MFAIVDRVTKVLQAGVESSLEHRGLAEVVVGQWLFGIELDRLAIRDGRLFKLCQVPKCIGQPCVQGIIAGGAPETVDSRSPHS